MIFSFRSLTAAQDGRSVLEHAGIGWSCCSAPQAISEQGCGYVVETADFEGARAFEQFLANGVRFRRCSDGTKTEWWRKRAMIYFDAAATALQKPRRCEKWRPTRWSITRVLEEGGYRAAMLASDAVYDCRKELAELLRRSRRTLSLR